MKDESNALEMTWSCALMETLSNGIGSTGLGIEDWAKVFPSTLINEVCKICFHESAIVEKTLFSCMSNFPV